MSAGTLGGDVTFVERVSSAAAAGFAGIGLTVGIVRRARAEGWTWSTMSGLLADNGLRVVELESVLDWAVADRRLVERHCEKLFAIAEELGGDYVLAGSDLPLDDPDVRLAPRCAMSAGSDVPSSDSARRAA